MSQLVNPLPTDHVGIQRQVILNRGPMNENSECIYLSFMSNLIYTEVSSHNASHNASFQDALDSIIKVQLRGLRSFATIFDIIYNRAAIMTFEEFALNPLPNISEHQYILSSQRRDGLPNINPPPEEYWDNFVEAFTIEKKRVIAADGLAADINNLDFFVECDKRITAKLEAQADAEDKLWYAEDGF